MSVRLWNIWAPVVARVILGGVFLFAAFGKLPWTGNFGMEVAYSAHVGLPFPEVAVFLAFILETVVGCMLLLGWQTRMAATIAVPYILALGLIFYHNFSDPLTLGLFISHLQFIAALLYISVYGAKHVALKKD